MIAWHDNPHPTILLAEAPCDIRLPNMRLQLVHNLLVAIWRCHDDALKWLEYGREGQPPRPWVEKSSRHAESAVIAKMQSVYDKYMGK